MCTHHVVKTATILHIPLHVLMFLGHFEILNVHIAKNVQSNKNRANWISLTIISHSSSLQPIQSKGKLQHVPPKQNWQSQRHQELKRIQSNKIQLWQFHRLKAAHLWARKEKVGAEKETQLPKATFHGVLRQEIETWCKTCFLFIVPWKYSSADWQRGRTQKISGSAKAGLIRLPENLRMYMQRDDALSFLPSERQHVEEEEKRVVPTPSTRKQETNKSRDHSPDSLAEHKVRWGPDSLGWNRPHLHTQSGGEHSLQQPQPTEAQQSAKPASNHLSDAGSSDKTIAVFFWKCMYHWYNCFLSAFLWNWCEVQKPPLWENITHPAKLHFKEGGGWKTWR